MNKLKTSSAYTLLTDQARLNLINIIKSGNKTLIKMIERLLQEEEQLNIKNFNKLIKELSKAVSSTAKNFFKTTKL